MYFEGFVFHRDLKELLEEKLDGAERVSVIKEEKIGELMEKMKMGK